jgi:MarR family transcriptional regulator, transcriptional regulator for hemolysin
MTTPDLGLLFNSAGHAVDIELAVRLAELGTTPRQICVLGKALGAELPQSRLGELAGLDKTTMVVTMDELERAGLAERRPSPDDRRARIVTVTPKGEQLLRKGQRLVDEANKDILSVLPDADREVFVRCMTDLVSGRLARTPRPPAGTRTPRRSRNR